MNMNRRNLLKTAIGAAAVSKVEAAPVRGYLKPVEAHLTKIITQGTDVYGPMKTAMWMASLNTKTGRYPDEPRARIGQRVYREIAAPQGSTIYWDQPELVAAYNMTSLTGNPLFKKGVDDYIKAFLERGIDEHGLWQWGNHRYYDAFTDKFVGFGGAYHEIRPLTPAWEIFWRLYPKETEREIRVTLKRHVDPVSGLFNRPDDGKKGDAFVEAGSVFVESLCWLYKRNDDKTLVEAAAKIAGFSYDNRNKDTGLVENQSTQVRWDKFVSTTEISLWAGSLIRAADATGRKDFLEMADAAMTAFLKYGWDAKAGEYYGQIQVKNGRPSEKYDKAGEDVSGNYRYKHDGTKSGDPDMPDYHSDIWNALFPWHDYPMVFAEVCVELYRRTKAPRYSEAVERWVGVVKKHPAPTSALAGRGAYAELFGRAIHFLTDAGQTFNKPEYTAEARKLAEAAIKTLFEYGMFRSHASEDRYDAVDGTGFLLLALIYLETGKKPDYYGFGMV